MIKFIRLAPGCYVSTDRTFAIGREKSDSLSPEIAKNGLTWSVLQWRGDHWERTGIGFAHLVDAKCWVIDIVSRRKTVTI